VDDFLHNTTDVTIALSEIEVAETGRVFVVVSVGFELIPLLVERVKYANKRGLTIACDRLCARITLPIVVSLKRKSDEVVGNGRVEVCRNSLVIQGVQNQSIQFLIPTSIIEPFIHHIATH